jgi:hypothetical protein
MSDRRTRDVAWQYVQQNWPRVQARSPPGWAATLVESMGNFCSAERSSQVTEFFAEHTVPAASHALDKAHDSIADCVELRAAQGPNLKQWLQPVNGKVVEFADLRLSTPMTGQPIVLFEYEDRQGIRSIHQVALTCTGEGRGGLIYFGGYDKGKFSIFRADCIHRVVTL